VTLPGRASARASTWSTRLDVEHAPAP
jgi:hypothetical protein